MTNHPNRSQRTSEPRCSLKIRSRYGMFDFVIRDPNGFVYQHSTQSYESRAAAEAEGILAVMDATREFNATYFPDGAPRYEPILRPPA